MNFCSHHVIMDTRFEINNTLYAGPNPRLTGHLLITCLLLFMRVTTPDYPVVINGYSGRSVISC